MSKEEKKAIKLKNEEIVKEYGFCTLDGHKEKIGNFRVEPPGLFRGRGEHPKQVGVYSRFPPLPLIFCPLYTVRGTNSGALFQGMVKRRLVAKDIVINCGRDSKVPEPPPGQRWKKVQHDNTVTWLACWKENIQGQIKSVHSYICQCVSYDVLPFALRLHVRVLMRYFSDCFPACI